MYYSVKDFTSSTATWHESLQCIFYASISIQYCNETENHFVSQNNSDNVFHASWTCVHKLAQNDGLFAFLTEPSWPPLLPAPLFQLPSLLEALLAIRCACRLCFSGRRREVVCYHRLKWPGGLHSSLFAAHKGASASGRGSYCWGLHTQEDNSQPVYQLSGLSFPFIFPAQVTVHEEFTVSRGFVLSKYRLD